MFFRAVGRRVAVDIPSWHLPLTLDQSLARLRGLGFIVHETKFETLARSVIGKATYRRSAPLAAAPYAFDCSSFVKWLYAERGIWIPRRCLHQFHSGTPVEENAILPGDLVFLNGTPCPPLGTPENRVSHVGIVIDNGIVVHATPETMYGIACEKLTSWRQKKIWRGARRFIPPDHSILTIEIPPDREIETSDDVCWHLLETLDWST